MKTTSLLVLAALSGAGLAHPGHPEPESELLAKRNFNVLARRGLAACAGKLEKRGHHKQAAERRAATAEKYRRAWGIAKRDTDSVLATSHLSNETYTNATSESTIFSDSNTCVLNPEGEVGPYWVKGEYVRSDLREDQDGIPIIIEGQFLDVSTCEPVTNVWWDIWNCNATGVYSGVVENGNGNTDDTSNINATFLRGVQQADSDGVVTFQSIFPGHYTGRTTHHHMIARLDGTIAANGTLTGGSVAHIGQAFWDQDLITQVEATAPYTSNTQTLTTNAEDRVFSTETEDTTSDPVFEYVLLGDDLSDGIFGWITIAINTSATYDPTYSFELTAAGGVASSGGSSDTVSGGSSGGPGGSGNFTGGSGNFTGGFGGNSTASGSLPSGPSGSLIVSGTATATSGSAATTSSTSVEAATGGATSGTSFLTVTTSATSAVHASPSEYTADASQSDVHHAEGATGSQSQQAGQTPTFAISPSRSLSSGGRSGKSGQKSAQQGGQCGGHATGRSSASLAGQPSGTIIGLPTAETMEQPSGKSSHFGNGASKEKQSGNTYW